MYAKRQGGDRNDTPARSRCLLTKGDHDHEHTGQLPRRGEGHLDKAGLATHDFGRLVRTGMIGCPFGRIAPERTPDDEPGPVGQPNVRTGLMVAPDRESAIAVLTWLNG